MQERCNSSALAMELQLSYIKLSTCGSKKNIYKLEAA